MVVGIAPLEIPVFARLFCSLWQIKGNTQTRDIPNIDVAVYNNGVG